MTTPVGGPARKPPCRTFDEACTRSGPWMAAGSPPHPFDSDPDEKWCRECGCAEPGQQHHGGLPAPEPPRPSPFRNG